VPAINRDFDFKAERNDSFLCCW